MNERKTISMKIELFSSIITLKKNNFVQYFFFLVCLLVAGPGGPFTSLHDPHASFPHHHLDLQLHRTGSVGGGGAGGIGAHHAMSYHNMFTPSRDPGTMWRCRSCGKEVTNRWHHYHSHTAQRSMCPYCPATYSRIDTLRTHLRSKHPERFFKH